jgi:hypothetical protein
MRLEAIEPGEAPERQLVLREPWFGGLTKGYSPDE